MSNNAYSLILNGKTYLLTINPKIDEFEITVNHYTFNKIHPSGNVGVQIHHIDQIKDGVDTRWYLSVQDLNRIGEFLFRILIEFSFAIFP